MRNALIAATLLAALVAGCVAGPELPEAPAAPLPLATPNLSFLPRVDLACPTDAAATVLDTVNQRSCGGFGEPVIEVAGDGAIWASATCCVGRSPPIWVSRDGGKTFATLPFADGTGATRDATGIEGDFAMDEAGNVFFFDIMLATGYFTKYTADGTHVFTAPVPFESRTVDRPWVRAGAADEVFILFNTGSSSQFYSSTDGGRVWDYAGMHQFPCALMTLGQGVARNEMFVAGCTDSPGIWFTKDKGKTWSDKVKLAMPKNKVTASNNGVEFFMPPVADSAGNVYVPFTRAMDTKASQVGLFVDVFHADGSQTGPFAISTHGQNYKPWPAAAGPGQFAVAWYATNKTAKGGSVGDDAEWFLQVAASSNANTTAPTFQTMTADPVPVLKGEFGRSLGDFLQSDIGPDGRIFVTYASGATAEDVIHVVATDAGLGFAPGTPHNGPAAA